MRARPKPVELPEPMPTGAPVPVRFVILPELTYDALVAEAERQGLTLAELLQRAIETALGGNHGRG